MFDFDRSPETWARFVSVDCPKCGAKKGQRCIAMSEDEALLMDRAEAGVPSAHMSRLKLAGVAEPAPARKREVAQLELSCAGGLEILEEISAREEIIDRARKHYMRVTTVAESMREPSVYYEFVMAEMAAAGHPIHVTVGKDHWARHAKCHRTFSPFGEFQRLPLGTPVEVTSSGGTRVRLPRWVCTCGDSIGFRHLELVHAEDLCNARGGEGRSS